MIRKEDFVDGLIFNVNNDHSVAYVLEYDKNNECLWILSGSILIARVEKITNTGFHWSKFYFETLIQENHKFMDLTKVN